MHAKTIRVLVVDDSALSRELISDHITAAEGLEVVGTARDGAAALADIKRLQPDIVTLDVHMPRMGGLEALDAILEEAAVPVIMVSSATERGAETALRALERGALDYVPKPANLPAATGEFRDELIRKLRMMVGSDVRRVLRVRQTRSQRQQSRLAATVAAAAPSASEASGSQFDQACVAIGISTGGPPALAGLFAALRPPLPPIVVVQHMPENFTGPFARRLDSISAIAVAEAAGGEPLRPNTAWLARGGCHLRIERRLGRSTIRLEEGEFVSGHRPSIDVMMRDASRAAGDRCLGVIMTGMGHDGVAGCAAIRAAGGFVLGQDEATSDVYGMNKVAFTSGHVDSQFALEKLPGLLTQLSAKRLSRERAGAASR